MVAQSFDEKKKNSELESRSTCLFMKSEILYAVKSIHVSARHWRRVMFHQFV